MTNFEACNTILKDIVVGGVPFSTSIKVHFQKLGISRENGNLISGLLGCELRHHELLLMVSKEKFSFADISEYFPIMLLLANTLFYKRFDYDQMVQQVSKLYDCKAKEINDFVTEVNNREEKIPANIEKGSAKYLAVRYNTPAWVVDMWIKHFGRNNAVNTLKSNYKASQKFLGVNSLLTTKEKVLEVEGFKDGGKDNLVIYEGKAPLRTSEVVAKHHVYYAKPNLKYIAENLDIEPFHKVAIFSSFSNNFYLDLGTKMGFDMSAEIITPEYQDFCDVKNNLKLFKFSKSHVYEVKAHSIITCVSEPVDCFVVMPRSSNFDMLKSSPDYFLRIKQRELDEIINEQIYTMEEVASLVREGGTLIYAVPTLNKKESNGIIRNFLLLHNNFSLVEEKQFFSFEEGESNLYFAKLINKGKPRW